MLHKILKFFGFKKILEILARRFKALNLENMRAHHRTISNYSYDLSVEDTYTELKKEITKSSIFHDKYHVRDYCINLINQDNNKINNKVCYEFGVRNGLSINYFSSKINLKFYGFDSFKGIPEDWLGTSGVQGSFSANGIIPKVNKNVTIIEGLIEQTLDNFLANHDKKIAFIHIDVDIYSTTKFILDKIKNLIDNKTLILFDDFCCFPGWRHGQFKALNEVFEKNQIKYIAFGGEVCAIKINK